MSDLGERIRQLPPDQRRQVSEILQKKLAAVAVGKASAGDYDAVILGGGLAGLTLARQLRRQRPETRILVVERRPHPAPEAAFKVGESTVEIGSHYLRETVGLGDHLDACHLRKAGLRFFFPAGDNRDIARRVEFGGRIIPEFRTYQIDRGRLENFLASNNSELGIEFWDDSQAGEIIFGSEKHTLMIRRGKEALRVRARWVLDASGRAGILKRQLRLAEEVSHGINAVWFRLNDSLNVDDWSAEPAWRSRVPEGYRRLATNHLVGRGYWVWLIALRSGPTSVGIVSDPALHSHQDLNQFDRALEWLDKHEPQCARVVRERKPLLQDFLALKHFSHGCRRVFSEQRWCITGDAGVFVDPFYSPGTDFIAIGNSLITDLVVRDLEKRPIKDRIEYYNFNYLNFFKLYLKTYEQQYLLMGNPRVMVPKVVWDWAIYWGVTTLLFLHNNKLFDQGWVSSVKYQLQRFNQLNSEMQCYFRGQDGNENEKKEWNDEFINFFGFARLEELYRALRERHSDEELKARVVKNIGLLETMAAEYQRDKWISAE